MFVFYVILQYVKLQKNLLSNPSHISVFVSPVYLHDLCIAPKAT